MNQAANLIVRHARAEDAERISALIAQLGFDAPPATLSARLMALARQGLPCLIAEADEIVGCVSLSVMTVLHRPLPVGRISMLVVASGWRGRGVGRALVEQAIDLLREAGCGLCEVTSNLALVEAHAFYEKLGFGATSLRLARSIEVSGS